MQQLVLHCAITHIKFKKGVIAIFELYALQKGLKKPHFVPQTDNQLVNYILSRKSNLEALGVEEIQKSEKRQVEQIGNDIIEFVRKNLMK